MRDDRPSSTAILIAAATVFLARDRRLSDLVPAEAAPACAQFLKSASPATATIVDMISRPAWRWAARLAERMTVPGLPLHFIVRKRCIEDAVRAGIAEGARQVVIIGAGFDTLALRLHHSHPDVRFFEIDHPATQSPKRTMLQPTAANLRFIEADLARARLTDVLTSDSEYLPDSYTVFVIEGLLMYLSQEAVNAVFNALSVARRARTRIVFTLMEPAPDGRLAFHNATLIERWLLSLWREPFRSAMPRGEIDAFLGSYGYSTISIRDENTLRAGYLAPSRRDALALAQGELVVVAERGNPA